MKEVSTISKRISIHALREEGDDDVSLLRRGDRISIHALREEGDRDADDRRAAVVGFLSTPSARRATCRPACIELFCSYFYPRPPRGGRLVYWVVPPIVGYISIHALREEGDHAPGLPV